MKKAAMTFVATTALALFAGSAHPSLVLLGAGPFRGVGIGDVSVVLTLQSPGSTTTETGAIVANGAGQTITGDAFTRASHTTLRTLSSIGAPSARNFRVILNATEPGDAAENGIGLSDLALTIYSPTGTVLYNSGAFVPLSFSSTFTGVGDAGFIFGLDVSQQAQAAAAFANPANRIGLSATLHDATGGPETLGVAVVPQPSVWSLMGVGVLGMFAMVHRRLRR